MNKEYELMQMALKIAEKDSTLGGRSFKEQVFKVYDAIAEKINDSLFNSAREKIKVLPKYKVVGAIIEKRGVNDEIAMTNNTYHFDNGDVNHIEKLPVNAKSGLVLIQDLEKLF